MLYTPLIKKAMNICYKAHDGQLDHGGMPYIFHPVHLAEQMDTEDEICTALLHDVIEDTGVSMSELREEGFPERVLHALSLLSHNLTVPYMTYILEIRSDPLARKVKMADLLHNSDSSRLFEFGDYDIRRRQKYLIAYALLETPYINDEGLAIRSIPLDQDNECFLILYLSGSTIKDAEFVTNCSDGKKVFLCDDNMKRSIKDSFFSGGRSLPERYAETLRSLGKDRFEDFLRQNGCTTDTYKQ